MEQPNTLTKIQFIKAVEDMLNSTTARAENDSIDKAINQSSAMSFRAVLKLAELLPD